MCQQFQEDYACVHNMEEHVEELDLPAQNADLDHIQHHWNELEHRL